MPDIILPGVSQDPEYLERVALEKSIDRMDYVRSRCSTGTAREMVATYFEVAKECAARGHVSGFDDYLADARSEARRLSIPLDEVGASDKEIKAAEADALFNGIIQTMKSVEKSAGYGDTFGVESGLKEVQGYTSRGSFDLVRFGYPDETIMEIKTETLTNFLVKEVKNGLAGTYGYGESDAEHDIVAEVLGDVWTGQMLGDAQRLGVKNITKLLSMHAAEFLKMADKKVDHVPDPAQPTYPVVHLAIDVHPPGSRMDEAAWKKYLEAEKATIQDCKERGIPVIYVAIGNSSQLYPPDASRDPNLVKELNLVDINPGNQDAIFLKRFMDGFTDIRDIRGKPDLVNYLAGQRKDGQKEGLSYMDAHFGDVTLKDYLKSLGAEQVVISGAMAQFCITDNSIGAAMKGFDVTVLTDRVIGWEDHTCKKMVWYKDDPAHHAADIHHTMDEIMDDPQKRGFTTDDLGALQTARGKINMTTSLEFLASVPKQTFKSTADNSAKASLNL